MKLGWIVLAALAGAVPASAAAAAPQQAAAKDWSRSVALTPDGGFRMGNPAARVKLVEYGSLTCPHCAHFAAEANPALRAYVRSGDVSFEYRNYVLNGVDVAATLLARCGGAKSFFPIAEAMYASQREWIAAIAGLGSEQARAIAALPLEQKLKRFAEAGGLTTIAAKHGVTPAEANKCLSDEAQMERLEAMYQTGKRLGVQGTPSFFINGTKVNAADWSALEPALRKALGKGA